ncbi:uncharacterized protein LOC142327795 [Lycorma delicatula]|uniref:uncharacterized protein LOC142327795 n=1 Tax=Lycorma delicatula TaxID=130591 RepID=UPI003F51AA34
MDLISVMKFKITIIITLLLMKNEGIIAQQSSNIGDFIGQLTTLLNQGGGLASALGGLGGGNLQGVPPPGAGFGPVGPGGYFGHGVRPDGFTGSLPGSPQGGGYGFPNRPPPPAQLHPGGIPLGGGYPSNSLYGALSSIAQFDDLRCVPRLLCEVAAGSRPGSSYTSTSSSTAGPIPFLSKDAVITLLTVLNFVDDSPLLVFGRAAVLGYTARGDPRACLVAYPTCPRDPDKLVDYLNNHNGGFFRFFNQQIPQYAPQYQYYQNPSHLGIPPQQYHHPQQYYQHPRPIPPPPPSPQRPYRRPPPSYQQYYQQQGRIQNSPPGSELEYITSEGGTNKLVFSSSLDPAQYSFSNNNDEKQQEEQEQINRQNQYQRYSDNYNYNYFNNHKFVFPTSSSSLPSTLSSSTSSSQAPSVIPLPSSSQQSYSQDSTGSYSNRDTRRGKTLSFPNEQQSSIQNTKPLSSTMVFPDRTGTGDLRLDLDEYGGYKTVHFASDSSNTKLGIFRDQRDVIKNLLKFPNNDKIIFSENNSSNKRTTRDSENKMHFPNT